MQVRRQCSQTWVIFRSCRSRLVNLLLLPISQLGSFSGLFWAQNRRNWGVDDTSIATNFLMKPNLTFTKPWLYNFRKHFCAQIAFTGVVYPCLILSYMGQAAYLSKHPEHIGRTFYMSIPSKTSEPSSILSSCPRIRRSSSRCCKQWAPVEVDENCDVNSISCTWVPWVLTFLLFVKWYGNESWFYFDSSS